MEIWLSYFGSIKGHIPKPAFFGCSEGILSPGLQGCLRLSPEGGVIFKNGEQGERKWTEAQSLDYVCFNGRIVALSIKANFS